MKKFIGIIALLLWTGAAMGQGKFIEIVGTNVNLRERPTANSKKLVWGENDEDWPRFDYQGKSASSCQKIFYSPETRGEWRKVVMERGMVEEAWVMAKYTKEISPVKIESAEQLKKVSDGRFMIRTKQPGAGMIIDNQSNEGGPQYGLMGFVNGAVVTLETLDCYHFNHKEGNTPLSIKSEEGGFFKAIVYSDRHTTDHKLDLDKLTSEEMTKLKDVFNYYKPGFKQEPGICYYYFAPKEERDWNGNWKDYWVTIPYEEIKNVK